MHEHPSRKRLESPCDGRTIAETAGNSIFHAMNTRSNGKSRSITHQATRPCRDILKVAAMFSCLCASKLEAEGIYTHWVSNTFTTATGILGESTVSLSTDTAVYGGTFSSPVIVGITNGSAAFFSAPYFTPSKTNSDALGLVSASSFTLIFDPPVSNPTLQIYELADNTLSFSDGTHVISFTLVSSDGNFHSLGGSVMTNGSSSSTLEGIQSDTDASGSIMFAGTFSRLSWVSDAVRPADGMILQISLPSLPPPILRIRQIDNSSALIFWPGAAGDFVLQQEFVLPGTNWVNNTNAIIFANQTNYVIVPIFSGGMFFRLAQ